MNTASQSGNKKTKFSIKLKCSVTCMVQASDWSRMHGERTLISAWFVCHKLNAPLTCMLHQAQAKASLYYGFLKNIICLRAHKVNIKI